MKQERPGVPVVVVSRLPEASLWLNALGTPEYCAAPFQSTQIKWLQSVLNSAAFPYNAPMTAMA
jgi:hypothetical protein